MRVVTIVAVLAVTLTLAACGGGDDSASETTGSAFDTGIFQTTEEAPETETQPTQTTAEPFQITVPTSAPIGPTSPQKTIKQLQRALLLLGYKIGKADGVWGEKTSKAVVAFQKKQKLGADGLVGAKTARAINQELAKLESGS